MYNKLLVTGHCIIIQNKINTRVILKQIYIDKNKIIIIIVLVKYHILN